MFKGKVVVPDDSELRTFIISQCHDPPLAGHPGWHPTLKRVESHFFWDTMRFDVYQYVMHCEMCQRNKANKAKEAGMLRPLPVPGRYFSRLNMDLITKLPKSGAGYDSIFVVKDALSKMVHIVPCRESMSASEFAELFHREVVRLHGVPDQVVTDRGVLE